VNTAILLKGWLLSSNFDPRHILFPGKGEGKRLPRDGDFRMVGWRIDIIASTECHGIVTRNANAPVSLHQGARNARQRSDDTLVIGSTGDHSGASILIRQMNPSHHKIMVVDNDQEWVQSMTDYLRICGFRVASVRSSLLILEKVLAEAPSLILLDLMSPRREGLKVCRILSQNYAAQYIPIIMVARRGDESDKIVALELGVDDFVHKPLNFHELSLRIERSLDRAAVRTKIASDS
jgi:PleD family two-component response regulator